MSVILYGEVTFRRLGATLKLRAKELECHFGSPMGSKVQRRIWDSIEEFVQKLRHANIEAWNERYDENVEYTMVDFKAIVKTHYTPMELIKTLTGIDYNCDESVAFEETKKRLNEIIYTLMYDYLIDTPGWEKARETLMEEQ